MTDFRCAGWLLSRRNWTFTADRKWIGTPVGLTAQTNLEEADELEESEGEMLSTAVGTSPATARGNGTQTQTPAEATNRSRRESSRTKRPRIADSDATSEED